MSWARYAALSLITLGLVACGGGGGGEDPPPVAVAPSITAQPAGQTVVAGASATFAVTATGTAPLVYQWLRNGADVAGATQSTHTVPVASMQDSGSKWSVRVANAAGSVTSSEAVLTVTPAPIALGISLTGGSAASTGSLDGAGQAAYFNSPSGIAIAADGSVYVADQNNRTIRKVTANGSVSTIAGQVGVIGSQDGAGALATFAFPTDIALGKDGILYIVDAGKLRSLTPQGQVVTMTSPATLTAIATAPDGTLYGASATAVWSLQPQSASFCAGFMCPASGILLAGQQGASGTADGAGTDARFFDIADIAVDAARNIYVSQPRTHTIRKVSAANAVTTLAGVNSALGSVDGTGSGARFSVPTGLTLDSAGNLWVAERGSGKFRKVSPAGEVTTPYGAQRTFFPNTLNTPVPIAMAPSGHLHFSIGRGISRVDAAGTITSIAGHDGAADAAGVGSVIGLATDPAGNVIVAGVTGSLAGTGPIQLSKFTPAGERLAYTATIQQQPGGFSALQVDFAGVGADAAGNVYVASVSSALTGLNVVSPRGGVISKVAPDGSVSVAVAWADGSAGAIAPAFMTVGRDGALYFIDLFTGNVVRWTAAAGPVVLAYVGPVFNLFSLGPWALAADASGTVYIMKNRLVQKVQNGALVTVAGAVFESGTQDGPGAQARFIADGPMVTDAGGNLYVADREVVRKITPQGVVSTLVGQRGSFGLRTGPLPGSLSIVGPMAVAPDGVLHLISEQALVKVRFQ